MMLRTKTKTVKSVEAISVFGRILQRIKGSPKTVQVEKKKQSRLTHFQITKIYKFWDESNPDDSRKYTLSQISMMIGATQQCIRYWIDKRDEQKPGITKSNQAIDKTLKQGEEDVKFDKKGKWIPKRLRKIQVPLNQEQGLKNLDDLYTNEKYPVDHQADPRYFHPTIPEQVLATPEAFKDQKRRYNIGRATMKKIIVSKEEALRIPREDVAKAFERHSKKEPVDHHGTPHIPNRCCCGINEPEWVKVFPVNGYSSWTTNNRRQNWEKKKLGDRLRAEDEARKKNKEPEYYCSECNSKISKDQSMNTSQIYGKMFCPNHEPDRPRGGFVL